MSGSSHDTILDAPQTSIGAVEILKIGNCCKSGFLRRQCGLNRTFKFLKWKQQFVVVSRGCIYVYNDEYSSAPRKSQSLSVYNQVSRVEGRSPAMGFSLLPTNSKTTRGLVFCCISDSERKEWMAVLKEQMIKAHHVSERDSSMNPDIDEYVYLEKEVVPAVKIEPKPKAEPKPKSKSKVKSETETETEPKPKSVKDDDDDDNDETDSDGDDYTTIDDLDVVGDLRTTDGKPRRRPPTIKPPPPTQQAYNAVDLTTKRSSKPKVATPPPSPAATTPTTKTAPKKPPGQQMVRQASAYDYDGTDRAEVEKILLVRPEGTYLVRQSRNDNRKVLSVNVDGILKEFKIYVKDGQVTLNNTDYYSSLDVLLSHYNNNDLPNKSTSLFRAYSVTDPRYINEGGSKA